MSASSRIRHSPFSFGRRVEELVFYGSWRLQGAVPDMRVVASDASVRSEERVVDIHMAVDNFGKSHPNLVGKRWVLSLATERARDAAKRVYVRDGISGAELSLDEMVAHLGETVPAAAFLQTDKEGLVVVASYSEPSPASANPTVALDDATVARVAARVADAVRESVEARPKPIIVRDIGLSTAISSAEPLLMDYPEAAQLLGLCVPKPHESPEQTLRRGVNALRSRVSRGEIPRRCIEQTGRRVQFRRSALVALANGEMRRKP